MSRVLCDGRPLDGPCPLAFDVSFRIGPYCLTLRRDMAAEPDWELYPASAPDLQLVPPESGDDEEVVVEMATAQASTDTASAQPASEGRPSGDPERWRARWKAAEAHFKARADRLSGGTSSRPAAYPSQADAIREEPRPSGRPDASSDPQAGRAPDQAGLEAPRAGRPRRGYRGSSRPGPLPINPQMLRGLPVFPSPRP